MMRAVRLEGSELEATVADVVRALRDALAPDRVVLFGSFARGDQNRASDFDVVVVMRTPLPFCERIGRVLAACEGRTSGVPVEALVYTPEEWARMEAAGSSFAALVRREGRVLYDRESESHRGATMAQAGPA
jgi:predicted nucleotidyltransferase